MLIKLLLPQVTKFGSQRLSEYSRRRREEMYRQAALACKCPAPEPVECPPPPEPIVIVKKEGRNPYLFTFVGLILGLSVGAGLYYLNEYVLSEG
ncbi:hypothetical protein QUF63_06010 [Anaerolineales bacterium HSG25]|nr:hypothetical protein [Anaerolineales bacterium HSG25]